MGAFSSGVVVIFGILWTIFATVITSHMPFPLVGIIFPAFGVIFVIGAIVQFFYNLNNATAQNRFSEYDITSHTEEPDPLNQRFGPRSSVRPVNRPPLVRQTRQTAEESSEDRLRELQALREKGLISEEEYADQRQRIIAEI
jgi:hypothetical protein